MIFAWNEGIRRSRSGKIGEIILALPLLMHNGYFTDKKSRI